MGNTLMPRWARLITQGWHSMDNINPNYNIVGPSVVGNVALNIFCIPIGEAYKIQEQENEH